MGEMLLIIWWEKIWLRVALKPAHNTHHPSLQLTLIRWAQKTIHVGWSTGKRQRSPWSLPTGPSQASLSREQRGHISTVPRTAPPEAAQPIVVPFPELCHKDAQAPLARAIPFEFCSTFSTAPMRAYICPHACLSPQKLVTTQS